jgi:hypothetical protein
MKRELLLSVLGSVLLAGFTASAAIAAEPWEAYLGKVTVKKVVADQMTPDQLQARKVQLAKMLYSQATNPIIRAPADTCLAATAAPSTLPFNSAGTTVGRVDDIKLPPDTTNPTCTASSACTGTGTAGSLPRGAIYTGTGTGPDEAFRIRTSAACTLTIAMSPTGADLALEIFQTQCSNSLADCNCVSDAGTSGQTETVTLTAAAGTDYFVVTDGYSSGAVAPGPSAPYTLAITGTGCTLTPVEIQSFMVD